eukprot:scaffold4190_cov141-Isochrysis_galbana.AAC.3
MRAPTYHMHHIPRILYHVHHIPRTVLARLGPWPLAGPGLARLGPWPLALAGPGTGLAQAQAPYPPWVPSGSRGAPESARGPARSESRCAARLASSPCIFI